MTSKAKPKAEKETKPANAINKYKDECPCQLDYVLTQASAAIGHPDNPYYIEGFEWCERPRGMYLPRQGRDILIQRLTNSEKYGKQYDWLNEFVFEQYLDENKWRLVDLRDPSAGWWIAAGDWGDITERGQNKRQRWMSTIFMNRVQYHVVPTKDIKEHTLNGLDTVIRHMLFPSDSIYIKRLSYPGIVVYYGYRQQPEVVQRLFALMNAAAELRLWDTNNETLNEQQLERSADGGLKKGEKLTLYIENSYALSLRPQFLSALLSSGCFKVLRNGKPYDITTDPYALV